jgi:hypothetical protein
MKPEKPGTEEMHILNLISNPCEGSEEGRLAEKVRQTPSAMR